MKIVVCVKTTTGAALNAEDAFQRGGRVGPSLLGPFDKHAVEEAIRIVECIGGGEIVVIAVAPAEALGAVREALSLGAQRAIMLSDQALEKSDLLAVSRALAVVLEAERADLYLTCSWSGDIDGTLLWVATAERLKLPVLTQARSLALSDDRVMIQRQIEAGDLTLSASLPCMVEVTETINKPRYATMKGKQAAKSRPVRIARLAEYGIQSGTVGSAGTGTHVISMGKTSSPRNPVVIGDPNLAPEEIVAFLENRNLI